MNKEFYKCIIVLPTMISSFNVIIYVKCWKTKSFFSQLQCVPNDAYYISYLGYYLGLLYIALWIIVIGQENNYCLL